MKLIVAGSRTFNNRALLQRQLATTHAKRSVELVISGGAQGADSLALIAAAILGLPTLRMPADWRFGKGAGFTRNHQMAKLGDELLCYWDGKSNGTRHMIDCMRKLGKPVTITYFGAPDAKTSG